MILLSSPYQDLHLSKYTMVRVTKYAPRVMLCHGNNIFACHPEELWKKANPSVGPDGNSASS